MKTIYKLSAGLALTLSIVLMLVLVSGCEGKGSGETAPTPTPASGGDSGQTEAFSCALPACSGDDCCNEDDSDCDDWCNDNSHLDLSGDTAKKCRGLAKDTVKDLLRFFGTSSRGLSDPNKVFTQPTEEKLDALKNTDIALICGAVKELDSDLLKNKVEGYTPLHARRVLNWIAQKEATIEIFNNAEGDNKDREIMKILLHKASNGTGTPTDAGVLAGLSANVNNDNDQNVLAIAEDEDNESLIQYLHQRIIGSDKELCKSANLPAPSSAYSGSARTDANSFKDQACVLAVYCKIAPAGNSKNQDFRKRVASLVDGSKEVEDFIKTAKTDGGLDGEGTASISDEDATEWPDQACTNLTSFWEDGGLDFGL